jgi:hypothetical protein
VAEELAGYSWVNLTNVPGLVGGSPLFRLGEADAYLFDAYVARRFRGRNLAPWLRHRVHQECARLGRSNLYSVTLAFNSSSRRFKDKLGAEEIELRVLVGLRNGRRWDWRLRSLTDAALPTRRGMLAWKLADTDAGETGA